MRTVIAFILFAASASWAATVHAVSCSSADVNAAIASASSGDTVDIPSGGSCAWSGVSIPNTKGITLDGLGITTITGGGVTVTPNTTTGTRITGFLCTGSFTLVTWHMGANPAPGRIDHNSCTGGNATYVKVDTGIGTLLIDHNSFPANGNGETIHNEAYGAGSNTGWTNDVTPGSPNQVYIEDNTFTNINSTFLCSAVQSYYGGRTVIRHNNIHFCQVDQHGTAGSVGARWWEIYENTFFPDSKNLCCYGQIRGGSGVLFNNHVSGSNTHGGTGGQGGTGAGFVFWEEDSGTWPLAYQIGSGINGQTNQHANCGTTNNSPAYTWGNDSVVALTVSGPVQFGRDVFVSASQPSALQRGQLSTDTCSTTYDYVPFTYPYPLTATGFPDPTGGSQVALPTFNPTGGTYNVVQDVSISSTTLGAVICFTTDGSDPITDSNGNCTHGGIYSTPVHIVVGTAVIKAVGTISGGIDSAVVSSTYNIVPVSVTTPSFVISQLKEDLHDPQTHAGGNVVDRVSVRAR